MNKFKKILLGTLSVLTLWLFVVTGTKVNATTLEETHYIKLNGTTKDNLNTEYTVNGGNYITSDFDKSGASGVTYTSIVDSGASIETKKAAKLNSTGYVSWTTKGDWTGYAIFGIRAADASAGCIKMDGGDPLKLYNYSVETGTRNVTVGSEVTAPSAGVAYLSEISGEKGLQKIVRSNLECFLIELYWEDSYESDTNYYNVNYYSSKTAYTNEEAALHTDSVEENTTTTAYTAYNIGKTFDCWKNITDDSTFNFSTAITGTVNLYATWKETSISNSDENVLPLSYIKTLYEEWGNGQTTQKEDLSNTIYSFGTSVNLIADKKTIADFGDSTAAIHTNGTTAEGSNSIYIKVPAKGELTVYARSGSSSDISYGLYNSSHTLIDGTDSAATSNIEKKTYNITTSGTYEFGASGAIYVYYIGFEDQSIYTPADYSIELKASNESEIYVKTTGNYTTGTKEYKGVTYTSALKMESTTSFAINAPVDGIITLVTSGASGKKITVAGADCAVDSNGCYSFVVSAGTSYVLTKKDALNLFYIDYKTVELYQSRGTKTDSTVFQRYVAILNGFAAADVSSISLEISVYSDSDCTSKIKTITKTPLVYDVLSQSGGNYSYEIEDKTYEFKSRNYTKYALYNLAVADSSHTTYVNNYIVAKLTVNGLSVTSSPVKITM